MANSLAGYTDDELTAELRLRGLFLTDNLAKWPVYQLATEILPVICTDLIPIRLVDGNYQIGVIRRATGPESGKLALPGGRVGRNESITETISRHLRNDLAVTNWQFYPGNNVTRPFYVQQYFHTSQIQGDYGFDPTKHAISLTYIIEINHHPQPKNEAGSFLWITETEIPALTAYNHGIVMKQAFLFSREHVV